MLEWTGWSGALHSASWTRSDRRMASRQPELIRARLDQFEYVLVLALQILAGFGALPPLGNWTS